MIVDCIPTAAKKMLLELLLQDPWHIALLGAEASPGQHTTKYSPQGECSGLGYKAGGKPLAGGRVVMDGDVACLTFDDVKWPVCSVTAHGAVVYNGRTRDVIRVLDFGGAKISTNGPFTVFMPLAARDTALFAL